jgi:hypothetical protein
LLFRCNLYRYASDEEMARLRDAHPSKSGDISMARRRAAVAGSMRHAWGGYVAHAWPEVGRAASCEFSWPI